MAFKPFLDLDVRCVHKPGEHTGVLYYGAALLPRAPRGYRTVNNEKIMAAQSADRIPPMTADSERVTQSNSLRYTISQLFFQ